MKLKLKDITSKARSKKKPGNATSAVKDNGNSKEPFSTNNYKPVNIDTDLSGESFAWGKKVWKVASLIKHAKQQDLEIFDLPLCVIDLSVAVWETGDMGIKNFSKHIKRVTDTDLKYPVILDDNGFIMDGWHRIVKALSLELATIKAVRFDKTPDCDYEKN